MQLLSLELRYLTQILAFFLVVSIPLAYFLSDTKASGIGLHTWTYFALSLLCLASYQALGNLFKTAHTLNQLRAPHALWRAYLSTLTRKIATAICIVLIAGVVLTPSSWQASAWLLHGAVICLSVSAVYLWAFFAHGLLPSSAAYLILSVMAFILAAHWMPDMVLDIQPMMTHWLTLSLGCLSWPLLVWFLHHRWQEIPQLSRAPNSWRSLTNSNFKTKIAIQLKRYTFLDPSRENQGKRNSLVYETINTRRQFIISALVILPVQILVYIQPSQILLAWQGDYTLIHLILFLTLASGLSLQLFAKDLHWRYYLLPNSWMSKSIGTRLFLSSSLYHAIILLLIYSALQGMALAISSLMHDKHLASSFNAAHRIFIATFEFACILSLGVWMRSSDKPRRVRFYFIVASVLVVGALALGMALQGKAPMSSALFHADTSYLAVLILVTGWNLSMANRYWTREKLLPFLRH